MTRLLIIGSTEPKSAIEFSYLRGFRELGVDVTLFDPARAFYRFARNRVLNRAAWYMQHLWVGSEMRAFFARTTGWDIVVVFKGMFIPARSLADSIANSRGALWMCFDPDDPFDPGRGASTPHVRAAIPFYRTYLIWSRALVPKIQAAGCRDAVYFPFAADPSLHSPAVPRDRTLRDVVTFVGAYDATRADLLESIADLPLRIYGHGWDRVGRRSQLRDKVVPHMIFDAELRRVVTSSAASLNLLRAQNVGAHNMRTFEIPAMGGMMLTTRSAEQASFFPENEASLMFEGKSELRARVESILRGDHDTEALRRNALARVSQHTYLERARTLLEIARERR
jgi:hypothetical protein